MRVRKARSLTVCPWTQSTPSTHFKGEKLVSVEVAFKIVENGSRHHGHVDAVLSAMRQLEKLVGSRHSPERDLVVAMVVARILEPQSSD